MVEKIINLLAKETSNYSNLEKVIIK